MSVNAWVVSFGGISIDLAPNWRSLDFYRSKKKIESEDVALPAVGWGQWLGRSWAEIGSVY